MLQPWYINLVNHIGPFLPGVSGLVTTCHLIGVRHSSIQTFTYTTAALLMPTIQCISVSVFQESVSPSLLPKQQVTWPPPQSWGISLFPTSKQDRINHYYHFLLHRLGHGPIQYPYLIILEIILDFSIPVYPIFLFYSHGMQLTMI